MTEVPGRSAAPIRVAVIGIGVAARVIHIPALLDSSDYQLRGVSDPDPQRIAGFGDAVTVFSSVDEVAASSEIDAAIICTPPDSHFDISRRLIAGGKHVLVEKPLTPSVAEGTELVHQARTQGVALHVAHERRFQPTCERIRSIVREGRIGTPFYCGVHWGTNVKLDPERFAPERDAGGGFKAGYRWRWANPGIGGGVLQDHVPHYVDLLRDWTGEEPIAVFAEIKNVARDLMGWQPDASRWDDMGLAIVDFSGGLTLRLEVSVVGRTLSPLLHAGTGVGEWTEYGYILGTEGQLMFDFPMMQSSENGRISVWRSADAGADGIGWTMIEQVDPDRALGHAPSGAAKEMFNGQLSEFAKAIRGVPNRSPTGRDGLIPVMVTEAAYESAQSGTRQHIDVPATEETR